MTPSWNTLHNLCALLLLFCLYAYFAGLLYFMKNFWLIPHLAMPISLLFLTQCQSYGLWQKSLILYFIVLINILFHILSRGLPRERTEQTETLGKRRVVYEVSPTRSWPAKTRRA